jgi:2-methylaconitate isomerase
MAEMRIPAVFMRGGTSNGVFFHADALPAEAALRDRILLKVIGSPDPYGKQIDGMGGGSSSTSKVVLISKSKRPDCDVDYLYGAVSIGMPLIDWSGNCGNLTSAVGPFAVSEGLVDVPSDGTAVVRIWQANICKTIISHVQVKNGKVVEAGSFELDGVTFPSAEIRLEFLDPGGEEGDEGGGSMFPTGNLIDVLEVPGTGKFEATLINAGIPSIFMTAESLGLKGTELQQDVNTNPELLARLETVRAHCAVKMGLAANTSEATENRPHTPKLSFIAPPMDYTSSSGKAVSKDGIDLTARIVSMGKLHHAMTGTGAVAIAVAAAIPGTIVQRVLGDRAKAGVVRFGHPSGTLTVGAEAIKQDGGWVVTKAIMSRSARRLMDGWVTVNLPE